MVTPANKLRIAINECLKNRSPNSVLIREIYTFIESKISFDEEDIIPPNLHGNPVSEPRWRRNVRNVLKSDSDRGLIFRVGKGEYALIERPLGSESNLEDVKRFVVGEEYRDTGRPMNGADQFMRWINIPGSGIKNAGGIRGLRTLRSGVSGIDGLVLLTSSEPGNLHNPWQDDVSGKDGNLVYWGDAKAHPKKGIEDFQGNRYLRETAARPIPDRPFILHFSRHRQGWVEFTGVYTLQKLEVARMQDGEKSIKNLKVTLRRTADTEVDLRWIVDWRTKETLNERRRFAPKGWLDYLSREALPKTKNEADTEVNYVRANIPSSFVSKQMKLANDRGHGESKLYVGPVAKKKAFDRFFFGWHPLNIYEFDHVDMLLYLQEVEAEFSRHSKYKGVSKRLYNELMAKVDRISDLRVDLSSHTDRSRYYIRGNSEAWTLMRSLIVPLMSELVVERTKEHEGGYADYAIKLVKSAEVRPKNATSGVRQRAKPETKKRRRSRKSKASVPGDLRAVPQDLKDLVWKRCQGMCQANWRVDSSLDKNTGDICGSNENLEFDHIVPYSRGGKTTYRNLQLLCRKHNRMKSDREV